jgi:hypothetical protein
MLMSFSVHAGTSVSGNQNKNNSPNPVIAKNWECVHQGCPTYEDCFDYAIEKDWHFWSCGKCPLFSPQSPPKASPKNPEPGEKNKRTTDSLPQTKHGVWYRITSLLGAHK